MQRGYTKTEIRQTKKEAHENGHLREEDNIVSYPKTRYFNIQTIKVCKAFAQIYIQATY